MKSESEFQQELAVAYKSREDMETDFLKSNGSQDRFLAGYIAALEWGMEKADWYIRDGKVVR